MIELTFGKPKPTIANYGAVYVNLINPKGADAPRREDMEYYNDVTSFLLTLFPSDIVRVVDLRRGLYKRHGIYSFDSA